MITTPLDWDAKSQIPLARPSTFQYNRVGSVTWTTEELTPTTYRETEIQVYDERQLPEELRIRLIATPGGAYDSTMVSYRYDVNGQRIIKRIRETATGPDVIFERYVRDGNRLVGVFGENNELKNWNIGGAAGLVGRADPATLGYTRRFYVTDHLGSIRAVVDQSGTVIEGRDYYPYGLTMPGRFYVQADTTREGFTGHELDKETGDYYAGARYYGPALARWFVVDPLAEAYPGWSPYNYTMGNPVMLIDPDGMQSCDDGDCADLGGPPKELPSVSLYVGGTSINSNQALSWINESITNIIDNVFTLENAQTALAVVGTAAAVTALTLTGCGAAAGCMAAMGGAAALSTKIGAAGTFATVSGLAETGVGAIRYNSGEITKTDLLVSASATLSVGRIAGNVVSTTMNRTASSVLTPTGIDMGVDVSLVASRQILSNVASGIGGATGTIVGTGTNMILQSTTTQTAQYCQIPLACD